MGLTTPAIIVIVIVASLAAVSLGAALTRQMYPAEEHRFQPSHAQEMYMRSVRMRNLGIFHRESLVSSAGMGKDVESRYTLEETSSRG
ncbi:hypothetical protein CNMCM5623_004860 [Aspergillus felis]|uniref:Uncharacterized protein n=1 Tax=Aspergillus felis TaxID=1287682 RepID=A0A8H6UM64_9EURO|nr:hypothetical protein CNMCM5623_004860 [Aspergillus felis]KAF7183749.1 hypothetical protein CNMCM7691_004099 [Aspergillus felis]